MQNVQRDQQFHSLTATVTPAHTAPMARAPGAYNIVKDGKRGHVIGVAVTCPCGCRETKFFPYDPQSLFCDITSLEPPSFRHPVVFRRDHAFKLMEGAWYA